MENYQDLAAPVQQFLFKTAPEEASAFVDGVPAEEIRVVFSNRIQSNWEWDAATGTYLKFLLNGSPDLDANGTQISATNLLIFAPNYFDVEGLPSAKVGQSREDAIIATGGKLIYGLFDTKELGAPIKLFYGADQSVFLSPGKTFILLPPGVGSLASGVTPGSITYVSNGEEIARGF
ncbi:unannotated protein [freshwater metagenome]|uniref:Unannotated protein n=1 Tax=freshwater metagenome TaxID=449393 RepID=A0A6J6DDL9_9ZZZZ